MILTIIFFKKKKGVQKHLKFWDKRDKGYITPLDAISGFMTLGYSMLFSVAIGTMVSVFLSLSTQSGWIPDPLCRSNVNKIKAATNTSSGVFNEQGVFVSDKFEELFHRHAQSDKSGNTITLTEFINMTKEQEQLGTNIKAWVTGLIELCAAYFFIGHRGTLSKQDVRAAYDGSLFYRLKDTNRLMILDKDNSLHGAYLSQPAHPLSRRAWETRLNGLSHSIQAKSTLVLSDTRVNEWSLFVQDNMLSRLTKSRPVVLRGVSTPKTSMYRAQKTIDDPATLFPEGLTGVAKETHTSNMENNYLSSLLSQDPLEEPNPMISGVQIPLEQESLSDVYHINAQASSSSIGYAPSLTKSISTSSNESHSEPLMTSFLREDDVHFDWLTEGTGLTGVQAEKPVSNALIQPEVAVIEHPKASITPPPEDEPMMEKPVMETAVIETAAIETAVIEKPVSPTPIQTDNQERKMNKKVKNMSPDESQKSNHTPINTSWTIAK